MKKLSKYVTEGKHKLSEEDIFFLSEEELLREYSLDDLMDVLKSYEKYPGYGLAKDKELRERLGLSDLAATLLGVSYSGSRSKTTLEEIYIMGMTDWANSYALYSQMTTNSIIKSMNPNSTVKPYTAQSGIQPESNLSKGVQPSGGSQVTIKDPNVRFFDSGSMTINGGGAAAFAPAVSKTWTFPLPQAPSISGMVSTVGEIIQQGSTVTSQTLSAATPGLGSALASTNGRLTPASPVPQGGNSTPADPNGQKKPKKDDKDKDGAGSKTFRQATDVDAQSMQKMYEKYNASQSRNVASTKGNINGESVNLESVSGKIDPSNPTHKGNITTPTENYYTSSNGRLFDSEQKMIESLRETHKNTPNISGEIEIVSQRPVCDGCHSVIDQFQKDFPNIKVTIVEILTD